jgi:predicted nucleic acid-binding protein
MLQRRRSDAGARRGAKTAGRPPGIQEEIMLRQSVFAATVAAATLISAGAKADKSWCTDAHMQKMDTMVAEMTDAAKKKSAQEHLDASKAAMTSGDTDGCIAAMKLAHKDMGM